MAIDCLSKTPPRIFIILLIIIMKYSNIENVDSVDNLLFIDCHTFDHRPIKEL